MTSLNPDDRKVRLCRLFARYGVILSLLVLLVTSYSSVSTVAVVEDHTWNKTTKKNAVVDEQQQQEKPLFVLHVGPHKMATTFLQSQLCWQPEVTEPLLLKDNLVYLGTCGGGHALSKHAQFFRHGQDTFKDFSVFTNAVDKLHAASLGGIVVYEDFSSVPSEENMRSWAERLSLELNSRFRVKVLVGHRSLFEWLPSLYNEIGKMSEIYRRWPGDVVSDTKKYARPTPEAMPYIPFDPSDKRSTGLFFDVDTVLKRMRRDMMHHSRLVASIYSEYFDDISIIPMMNLHTPNALKKGVEVDPLLSYIFCDLLETPATCRGVRKGHLERPTRPTLSNPSKPFNYDMIAVEAYQLGLIPKPFEPIEDLVKDPRGRILANAQVKWRQEQALNRSSNDFPLECLSNETLDRFEEFSLTLDRNFFGDQWNSEWEERHHDGFWNAREKLFCWVNASKVLEDPEWQAFFKRAYASGD